MPSMPMRLHRGLLMAGCVMAMAAGGGAVQAGPMTYACDPGHTEVRFSYTHAGFSTQTGELDEITCSLTLDEADPASAKLQATVKAASIHTGVAALDADLAGEKFLDAAKFPDIGFTSTKVERTGDKTAKVTGDLTLHGVTRPVTLDVTLVAKGTHPVGQFFDYYKGEWAGFSATTTIKRSDFGVDGFVPVVSDELQIVIDAELKGG